MTNVLTLPPRLDLSTVATLHADLMARRGQDITLDVQAVGHLGALCLQVIIAAARQALSADTTFTLCNINDRVIAQLRVMGVTPETIMEGQP